MVVHSLWVFGKRMVFGITANIKLSCPMIIISSISSFTLKVFLVKNSGEGKWEVDNMNATLFLLMVGFGSQLNPGDCKNST
jgi:hypothetical protein